MSKFFKKSLAFAFALAISVSYIGTSLAIGENEKNSIPDSTVSQKVESLKPLKSSAKSKKEVMAPVDINSADLKALTSLKGIGPKKAQAIIDYRKTNGSFTRVDDLARVKGIGAKATARILKNNEGKILATHS